MKKIGCVLLALLLMAGMAGCGKTEAGSLYDAKGDRQLRGKILAGEANDGWYRELAENDMHIEKSITYDTLPARFVVDAQVTVASAQMPAAVVKPHRITQEEADVMLAYIVGDARFIQMDTPYATAGNVEIKYNKLPKQILAVYMDEYEKNIADCKSLESSSPEKEASKSAYIDAQEAELEECRKAYRTAKDMETFPEASRRFRKREYKAWGGGVWDGMGYTFVQGGEGIGIRDELPSFDETYVVDEIQGYFVKNDALFELKIRSDEVGRWSRVSLSQVFSRDEFSGYLSPNEAADTVESCEDAEKVAEDAAAAIGACAQGMQLLETDRTLDGVRYMSSFAREINGVAFNDEYIWPFTFFAMLIGEEEFESSWGYETLTIGVGAHGLESISWENPYDVTEVLAEEAPMLPLEQILACAAQGAFLDARIMKESENYDWHVTGISLNLMRVQAGEEYILVPVWDFYGNGSWGGAKAEQTMEGAPEEESRHLLTVNAVDGSIVDRAQGY